MPLATHTHTLKFLSPKCPKICGSGSVENSTHLIHVLLINKAVDAAVYRLKGLSHPYWTHWDVHFDWVPFSKTGENNWCCLSRVSQREQIPVGTTRIRMDLRFRILRYYIYTTALGEKTLRTLFLTTKITSTSHQELTFFRGPRSVKQVVVFEAVRDG